MTAREGNTAEPRSTEGTAADQPCLVEVRGLVKRFPGVVALRGVDLRIATGEIHALVGENGAGKSTLIKILSGVYPPDKGELLVRGEPTFVRSTHHAQELGITTIFQELSLATHLTGLQNLFLGRELRKGGLAGRSGIVDEPEMAALAAPLCQEFGLSPAVLHRPVEEMSALEQRVVMLLKSLIFKAELIIMDEITAGLADRERDALFDHMKILKKQGIAILWITHRLEELVGRADRASVLRDGMYVGDMRLDESGRNLDELVRMMIGSEISSHEELLEREIGRREPPGADAPVVLSVQGLSRGDAVRDVSFDVHAQEIVGVAGMAGSGRSELARAILGADRRDAGRIEVKGKVRRIRSPRQAYRAGVTLVPEERKTQAVFGELSVAENISAAALWKVLLAKMVIRKKREMSVAERYRSDLNIVTPTLRRFLAFLSGGNQQKVIIARSLFAEPSVMMLDEPTHGIDIAAKLEVYRLVNAFVESGGSAIVVSSELPELVNIADRVLVMREGRLAGALNGASHGSRGEKLALEERIVALATGATNGDKRVNEPASVSVGARQEPHAFAKGVGHGQDR